MRAGPNLADRFWAPAVLNFPRINVGLGVTNASSTAAKNIRAAG